MGNVHIMEVGKTMDEIVIIEKINIPTVFKKDGLDPIIGKIREEVESFKPDISTAKGRGDIKSFAYKIIRSKTYIDDVGKNYVAGLKMIPKIVDIERKRMRDELDTLYNSVRQPLTDYENEQKRIEEETKLCEEIATAYDQALIENEFIDKQRDIERREAEIKAKEEAQREREEKEKAERERIEREERLKAEAAENAKREVEARASREKAEAERRIAEEKLARERAEFEKEEAIKKAEIEKENAIKAEQEKARQEAIRTENERIAKERKEREENERRAADKIHQLQINREAMKSFMDEGLPEYTSKLVIALIAKGKIKNININY